MNDFDKTFSLRVEEGYRKNKIEILEKIQKVLERLAPSLSTPNFGETISFGPGSEPTSPDRVFLFDLLGIQPKEIQTVLKASKEIKNSWRILSNPFIWLVSLLLKTMIKENAKENELQLVVLYFAIHFYAGRQFKFFRRFFNQQIMDYAINTLSNKFTLKQEGTVLKAVFAIAWTCHLKYVNLLRNGSDLSLKDYILNLNTRIRGFVIALKSHYEKVKLEKKYVNVSLDAYDDETKKERETSAGKFETLAETSVTDFISDSVNKRILILVNKLTKITTHDIILIINNIKNSDEDLKLIVDLYKNLLSLFLQEKDKNITDIKTTFFIKYADFVFARSYTKDVKVERIKEILDILLAHNSENYIKTNRLATKISFRKAIYLYLIFYLQSKA